MFYLHINLFSQNLAQCKQCHLRKNPHQLLCSSSGWQQGFTVFILSQWGNILFAFVFIHSFILNPWRTRCGRTLIHGVAMPQTYSKEDTADIFTEIRTCKKSVHRLIHWFSNWEVISRDPKMVVEIKGKTTYFRLGNSCYTTVPVPVMSFPLRCLLARVGARTKKPLLSQIWHLVVMLWVKDVSLRGVASQKGLQINGQRISALFKLKDRKETLKGQVTFWQNVF